LPSIVSVTVSISDDHIPRKTAGLLLAPNVNDELRSPTLEFEAD
jgi:hypothetical protein